MPASRLPNAVVALSLSGDDTEILLSRALRRLAERHDILRTRFVPRAEGVRAITSGSASIGFATVDLGDLPRPLQTELLDQHAALLEMRPFALDREPPARFKLLRLGSSHYVIQAAIHPIAADRPSIRLLARDLDALLESERCGSPCPLPAPRRRFADYASRERTFLESGPGKALVESLALELRDVPPLAHLPLEQGRKRRQSAAEPVSREIEPVLLHALERIAAQKRVTLCVLMQTAFSVLLGAREGGAVAVKTTVRAAGTDFDDVVGPLSHGLVLRTDLGDDPRFDELLRRCGDEWRRAREQDRPPIEALVDSYARADGNLAAELPAAGFEYRDHTDTEVGLQTPPPGRGRRSDVMLELEVRHGVERCVLSWTFDASVLARRTIERLDVDFDRLLRSIALSPHARVRSLWLDAAALPETRGAAVDGPGAAGTDPATAVDGGGGVGDDDNSALDAFNAHDDGGDAEDLRIRVLEHFEGSREKARALDAAIADSIEVLRANGKVTTAHIAVDALKDRYVDATLPARPVSVEQYFEALKKDVLPFAVNVASPYYAGHMTSALPAFLPELSRLLTEINQNVVKIETSKSLTFIERQVLAMLHKLFFALPDRYYRERVQSADHNFGLFTSGGTTANLSAIWYAFNRALMARGLTKEQIRSQGTMESLRQLGYRDAVVIGSPLMHYSFRKAASLLGLGERGILTTRQRPDQKLCTEDLEDRIERCRESGTLVIAVVGIAGATETGVIDPLHAIADICRENAVHFHVDAAWGGALAFSRRHADKLLGIDGADTIAFCPHKQLYLPQGVSLCLLRDTDIRRSVTTHAPYQAQAGSFDLGQFTLEGSRPAVSLLLHASLHLLGRRGYAWLIDNGIAQTEILRELVADSDCFELVGEPEMNILNYRYVPTTIRRRRGDPGGPYSEQENEAISFAVRTIQERQFVKGDTFVSRTRLTNNAYGSAPIEVFRVVLSNPLTTRRHLEAILDDQRRIAAELIEPEQVPFDVPFVSPAGVPVDADPIDSSLAALGGRDAPPSIFTG